MRWGDDCAIRCLNFRNTWLVFGYPQRMLRRFDNIEARADVFDYIEVFYNRKRRHSHSGGVSPEAFEQASF